MENINQEELTIKGLMFYKGNAFGNSCKRKDNKIALRALYFLNVIIITVLIQYGTVCGVVMHSTFESRCVC